MHRIQHGEDTENPWVESREEPRKGVMMEKRLLSAREAAEYLGISHRTVWAWAQAGWLPVTRLGRRVLFDRSKLDGVIEQLTEDVSE